MFRFKINYLICEWRSQEKIWVTISKQTFTIFLHQIQEFEILLDWKLSIFKSKGTFYAFHHSVKIGWPTSKYTTSVFRVLTKVLFLMICHLNSLEKTTKPWRHLSRVWLPKREVELKHFCSCMFRYQCKLKKSFIWVIFLANVLLKFVAQLMQNRGCHRYVCPGIKKSILMQDTKSTNVKFCSLFT